METIYLKDYVKINLDYECILPENVRPESIGVVVDIENPEVVPYPYTVVFHSDTVEVFADCEITKATDEEVMLWKLSN